MQKKNLDQLNLKYANVNLAVVIQTLNTNVMLLEKYYNQQVLQLI